MITRVLQSNAMVLICCSGLAIDAPRAWAQDPDKPDNPYSWDSLGEPQQDERGPVTWGSNLRLTLDLATRVSGSTVTEEASFGQFVGIDLHQVITDEGRDIATMVLQAYLTRLDNTPMKPHFFEGSDHDWELVFRIFQVNFTGFSRGEFNVRVGHFELPFGLEHLVNTNGTLRDFMHGRNLGAKADWGVAINGEVDEWEYEVGLSRGTGNEWTDRGDPWIFAGRLGTHRDGNTVWGLSAMAGDVFAPAAPGNTIERLRFGGDVQHHWEAWSLLGEVAVGTDDSRDVVNCLVELDWHSPDEQWLVYLQGRAFFEEMLTTNSWADMTSVTIGSRFAPDNHWSYSIDWTQTLTSFRDGPHGGVVRLQARYRF